MKKKSWILACCLLIGRWCLCAPTRHFIFQNDCCILTSKVDTHRVKTRIGFYLKKKQRVNMQWLNDRAGYSKAAFMDMLNKTELDKNHDGIRVYFAAFPSAFCSGDSACDLIPKNAEGPVTLIFVPTTTGPDGIHHDDTTNFWVLMDSNAHPIGVKPAKAWVARAWNIYLSPFETKGRHTTITNFQESRSLWYSRPLLIDSLGGGQCSVLQYLNCKDNPTDSIYVYFAAFGHFQLETIPHGLHDFYYQLTLLFYMSNPGHSFEGGDGGPVISLVYKDLPWDMRNRYTRKKYFTAVEKTYTDTGKPCPPPTCQGAVLLIN